jgi:hypothetical protein
LSLELIKISGYKNIKVDDLKFWKKNHGNTVQFLWTIFNNKDQEHFNELQKNIRVFNDKFKNIQ